MISFIPAERSPRRARYWRHQAHTILSVPPKYAISDLMGFLKGKMALNLFHRYEKLGKQYWGRHLWSRGYCVSTIGLDEDQIRKYVRYQEKKDKVAEQQGLWDN